MPFNKGDFTQQGVAGHVNAILRLNEKRYVGIDLTSDENDEGCTISGAVYDLLNEEVYPIGAGVSGNIEITENGENINVAPYATATVNVSGGSATLGTLTIDKSEVNENVKVQFPRYENIEGYPFKDVPLEIARATTSITEKIPLNSSEHVFINLFLVYGANDYDLVGGDNTTVLLYKAYLDIDHSTELLRIYTISASTDAANVKFELPY